MFASRFFAPRYFAPRYFPPVLVVVVTGDGSGYGGLRFYPVKSREEAEDLSARLRREDEELLAIIIAAFESGMV